MRLKKLLFNKRLAIKVILLINLAIYCTPIDCQLKYDYNWVIASSADGIPGIDAYIIDFNDGKRSLREIAAHNRVHKGNAVISNQEGELQFFTNGCEIMDTLGDVVMNGEELISGEMYNLYCYLGNYPGIQNSTILPDPGSEQHYYYLQKEAIFTTFQGEFLGVYANLRASKVYSHDNITEVISKSEIIDSVGYRFSANMESILHANGTDWWIVDYLIRESEGSRLIYALDENEVKLSRTEEYENQEALAHFNSTEGQAAFAPNGDLYAKYDARTGLDLFDFDRATGEFSNYRHFSTLGYNLEKTYSGMAFSPNSRFIYISSHDKLHQLDLWEENLEDGFELIGEYDGYLDPYPTNFTWMQLGPDCRIYMTSTNGVSSYHVINNPDEKGLDCDFVQHGFELPIHNGLASIPNFPVFRFDEDDVCDPTITSVFDVPVEIIHNLDLFPNPTSDLISIAFPDDLRRGILYVKSMSGQVLHRESFDYAGSLQVSLGDYAAGIYIVEVVSEGKRYVDRVVKVE